MAAVPNSFSELEKRSLLLEIIKASDIPLEVLLNLINSSILEPKWPDVVLPAGRTLNACIAAFQELRTTFSSRQFHQRSLESHSPTSRKRRHSDTEPPLITARTLHPKPTTNGDPPASLQPATETAPTRRGRPPKSVLEARKKDAAARGVSYPTLKAAVSRKSTGVGPTTPVGSAVEGAGQASQPGSALEGGTDSPLLKKRRGRPPKSEADKKTGLLPLTTSKAVQDSVPSDAEKAGSEQTREVLDVVTSAPKDASITMASSVEVPDSAATTQTHHTLPNPQQSTPQQSGHS